MIDYELYSQAMKEALKVEFLANSEELKLYANALYSAVMWGREVEGNRQKQADDGEQETVNQIR